MLDLRWLVSEGYVAEYSDGRLVAHPVMAPSAPKTSEGSHGPAETPTESVHDAEVTPGTTESDEPASETEAPASSEPESVAPAAAPAESAPAEPVAPETIPDSSAPVSEPPAAPPIAPPAEESSAEEYGGGITASRIRFLNDAGSDGRSRDLEDVPR